MASGVDAAEVKTMPRHTPTVSKSGGLQLTELSVRVLSMIVHNFNIFLFNQFMFYVVLWFFCFDFLSPYWCHGEGLGGQN